ncbi:MAG: hypothetical protein JWM07_256 [Candidatus Saccharibacteria bacterium]|nr:hypothetical protein [Candidatus Saccharibacteria bacterium]
MTGQYTTVDLMDTKAVLSIAIQENSEFSSESLLSKTNICIEPLMTLLERSTILLSVGQDSELGKGLAAMQEDVGRQVITIDGMPSERHLSLGVALAEEIITLRGTQVAMVHAEINGKAERRLVEPRSFPRYKIHYQELLYSCGPTTLLNGMRLLRGDYSETEVGLAELCGAQPDIGITDEDIVALTGHERVGLEVLETKYDAELTDIKRCVDEAKSKGENPYVIINYFHAFAGEGHYAAVVDYDDKAVYIMDCSLGYLRLRKEYFKAHWHSTDKSTRGWYAAVR